MKHLRQDCNASHIAIGGACFNCGAKPEPQDRHAPTFTPAVVALLEQLVAAAGTQQVNLHVTLNDHDHSWYVSIDSSAPAERFISRDRPQLESAVEDALRWLTFLAWCGERRLNPTDPAIQRAAGLSR